MSACRKDGWSVVIAVCGLAGVLCVGYLQACAEPRGQQGVESTGKDKQKWTGLGSVTDSVNGVTCYTMAGSSGISCVRTRP